MKFVDNLFHHSSASFSSISGYDDVKNIINRVLSSEENFNLLLVGPPASSKTQFLMEIMKAREGKTVYFDATNTTNRILKVLEEERPEIVLLDELDNLPRNFAEKLLNFLESGRVKVDQKNWNSGGDIRDVISIGKLVRKSDGPQEIQMIMNTMAKYDGMMMQ